MASLLGILRPAATAAMRFWPTLLLLQLCAVAVVVAFYRWEGFQKVCKEFGTWKEHGGILFAALANVVAGVVVPEVAKALTARSDSDTGSASWRIRLWWLAVLFATSGVIVDTFYRLQGLLLGTATDLRTVAVKVLVDQLIFTPFVGLPYAVLFFLWLEEGRSVSRWWRRLRWQLVVERVLRLAAPGWLYWFPMVCCIYALPLELQFVLYLPCMACWSLVFVAISRSMVTTGQARNVCSGG